jgi:NitT/TauT family transport system substrate-binding protein
VASVFQNDPSVFMMQKDCPVNDWKDLEGMTVMARPEWAFIPYIQKKYDLKFNIVPQNFELGRLISDKNFVQQGFYIAEPFFVKEQGVELKFLYAWDTGFDAYTTLFANKAFANRHPEQLKAFLAALKKGYRYYMEIDSAPAHETMLKINAKVTPEFLDFSRNMIIDASLHKTEEADYLAISRERYQTQLDQLVDLEIIPPGKVTVDQVMSTSYAPN